MAATPRMMFVAIGIAVMAVTASEAKVKKRSIELPNDLYLKSDIRVVKKASSPVVSVDEPELFRSKRFKRDTPEVELQRVKRTKRDTGEGGLERVKRNKRTADEPEPALQRNKRIDDTTEEKALIRQKRFKRSVRLNKFNKDDFRMKRAGKAKKLSVSPLYDFPTVKRNKRGGIEKAMDTGKHAKNAHTHTHLRDKRRQPVNLEGAHTESKMGDVVKKAVEKLKRSKRRPKHSKSSKLHRSKRGGLKEERSAVLKDITRDISRLQRLRRGIAHEIIRDVKQQKARNHKNEKHVQSPNAVHIK